MDTHPDSTLPVVKHHPNPEYIRVSFEQGESLADIAAMFEIDRREVERLLRECLVERSAEMVDLRSRDTMF